ncbi:MAG TPA: tetratricopeptide repeat protein, partial [Thermoanaerobaculia bacterium]|nr:tetratricopeptide repeat protein [Thermoanaerobaculia bacterium]
RFLLDRTAEGREPAPDDAKQAGRLAELLGDLPLALAQAAAYISHTRLRLADYRGAWQRTLGWYDSRLMQYPASVVVTWQTTFEQLAPTAATLLRLTAFLAPEPIPVAMFEDGSDESCGTYSPAN